MNAEKTTEEMFTEISADIEKVNLLPESKAKVNKHIDFYEREKEIDKDYDLLNNDEQYIARLMNIKEYKKYSRSLLLT